MSRPQEGHRTVLPFFGNAFRIIRHRKSSHLSPKLASLQASFEETLTLILRKLTPKDASEVLTLAWMKQAVDGLSEAHVQIANLITDLEFPVSDWEQKWMDIYLDSSVKLLDICLALSAELARLDQGQLLLQYAVHVLDSSENKTNTMSSEKLERAHKSVQEWVEKLGLRSSKLQSCNVLNGLAGSLFTGNAKDSAKGRVLLRALYGVKVVTILLGGALVSALLGNSAPLVDLRVSEDFAWYEAFNGLKNIIYGEVGLRVLEGKASSVKEVQAVEVCARKLSELMRQKEDCMEVELREVDNNGVSQEDKRVEEGISNLKGSAEALRVGLDSLSKRVEDFFSVVLSGRDALLCNLRVYDADVIKA